MTQPPKTTTYTSAFETRELTVHPASLTFTLRAPSPGTRGTVEIARGTLGAGLSDDEAAEAAERHLPCGAEIWQPRVRGAGLVDGHRLRFPDEYVLMAVIERPGTDLEALFGRAQHFEASWHLARGVTARSGARPASMSTGDVMVLPGTGASGETFDVLGRPRRALRVLGCGWETLHQRPFMTVSGADGGQLAINLCDCQQAVMSRSEANRLSAVLSSPDPWARYEAGGVRWQRLQGYLRVSAEGGERSGAHDDTLTFDPAQVRAMAPFMAQVMTRAVDRNGGKVRLELAAVG